MSPDISPEKPAHRDGNGFVDVSAAIFGRDYNVWSTDSHQHDNIIVFTGYQSSKFYKEKTVENRECELHFCQRLMIYYDVIQCTQLHSN